VLFSSRVRVRNRVRVRFRVWLVSCYAHVFVLLSIVIVTLPLSQGRFEGPVGPCAHAVSFILPVNPCRREPKFAGFYRSKLPRVRGSAFCVLTSGAEPCCTYGYEHLVEGRLQLLEFVSGRVDRSGGGLISALKPMEESHSLGKGVKPP